MTSRCGDEGGNDPNQVIIHISWISQCLSAGCHNGRYLENLRMKEPRARARTGIYELICLIETGILHVQSICIYTRQRAIIQNNHRVRMVCKTFEGQKWVVWLNNDIRFLRIREYGVSLYEFLWKPVIQAFQQERSHSWASTTRYGVHKHETLDSQLIETNISGLNIAYFKWIAAFSFAFDHFHHFFIYSFPPCIALCPVITSSPAIFR